MNNFSLLNQWLDQFAQQLQPNQKRYLMRLLAQGLRVRMRDRIKQQKDPNDRRFVPRKRDQVGKIKRSGAMFQNIGRQIKTAYSASTAEVGFSDRTAKIARIHQYGQVDRPTKTAKPTRYYKRELVGFSDDDIQYIEQTIIDFLGRNHA